jgi:tetratricopeptide (TPR) repeat protein
MRFRKALTFLMLAMGLVFARCAWAQQKPPLTQEQVQGLVRNGLGDETGAKAIEQRGIDFAPTEDLLQALKTAGASDAFVAALRAATKAPTSTRKPLSQEQIFSLLVGQVPSQRVIMLIQERGIDFDPTDDHLQQIRGAGGEDDLITALKSAQVTKPTTVDSAAQTQQDQVRQHMARGAEFFQKHQYDQAEQEYRAALLLNPQSADLYMNLAYILDQQKKWDDAATAAREALRLNPNSGLAHNFLGLALEMKGDRQGALDEYRAALAQDPTNAQFKQSYDRMMQPLPPVGQPKAVSCVILKRMGPADEVTSHLYSFGIRGKQFQYVEGTVPKGVKFHGRLTDNDVRAIQDNGGKITVLEPKYTETDLEIARKSCQQ